MLIKDYVVVNAGDTYVSIVRIDGGWEAISIINEKRLDWDVSFNVLLNRCKRYGWVVVNV